MEPAPPPSYSETTGQPGPPQMASAPPAPQAAAGAAPYPAQAYPPPQQPASASYPPAAAAPAAAAPYPYPAAQPVAAPAPQYPPPPQQYPPPPQKDLQQPQPVGTTAAGGAPPAYPQAAQPGQPGATAYPTAQPQYVAQQPAGQTVVISSTQRTSPIYNSAYRLIPILPIGLAILALIINIFTSGLGTVIAGMCVFCVGHTYHVNQSRSEVACITVGIGLLQMFLFFWLIGWIWALYWGFLMIAASNELYGRPLSDPQQRSTVVVTS